MIATIVSWFTALFKWVGRFFEWFVGMFKDWMEFILDIPLAILEGVLDGAIYLLSMIPVPEFMASGGVLQPLFDQLPGELRYFAMFFGLPTAFALIGAGVAFRLTRKLATLGQW